MAHPKKKAGGRRETRKKSTNNSNGQRSTRSATGTGIAKRLRQIRQRAIQSKPRRVPLRRSMRSTRASQKSLEEQKAMQEKLAKQKRELEALVGSFKKPEAVRSFECSFDDITYQLGDTINVRGADNKKYYGKIVGFWSNKCCDRYVSIRWLIPKHDMGHPIWDEQDPEEFSPHLFREASMNDKIIPMQNIEFVGRFACETEEPIGEPFLMYDNEAYLSLTAPTRTLGSLASFV